MQRTFLIIAVLLACLAVVLGAFGAHGLKKVVGPDTVATYQTGVQYQMYHALALLVVALLMDRFPAHWLHYAGFFFIAGIVLFSGSLYLLASLKAMNRSAGIGIGLITPLGGLLFIAGWIFMLLALLRR